MKAYLRKLAIAAVAIAAVALGGAKRAEAGLFLAVSDGTTTKTDFDSGNVLFKAFTFSAYTLDLNLVSTNFPGEAAGGTLATSAQFSTRSGVTIPNLRIFAAVVDSATFDAGTGQFTPGPLSVFNIPTGSQLTLSNDTSASKGSATSGSFDFTSASNGATVNSDNVSIINFVRTGNSTGFDGTLGYTLANTILIKGVNAGASNVTVQGTSLVTSGVPEPTSLAMIFGALPIMGLAAMRRRRANA